MLADAKVIGFIPVRSIESASQFYCGLLGLRVLARTDFALVLSAGGSTVRCVLVPEMKPQPFTIFGWAVPKVGASTRALSAAGIAPLRYEAMVQDEDGVWTSPDGSKVAWFHDPEGNVLSLSQEASA